MPNPLPRKDRGTFENKRRQIRSESLIAHHSMYWNESHIAHRSISVRAPQNAVFVPHPEARAGRSIARRTQLEGGFEDSCGSRDPTTESLTAHQRRTQKENPDKARTPRARLLTLSLATVDLHKETTQHFGPISLYWKCRFNKYL
jgi:hypothetical protein